MLLRIVKRYKLAWREIVRPRYLCESLEPEEPRRGVFALIPFIKGDFVVEYRGEMVNLIEAEQRREANQDTFFMFDFIWQNKKWSIDATHEDGTLGRLINDDHINPNCTMKRIIVEGKPHLCLFAARDIIPGEELTYDYGGSDWPWRKPPCKDDDKMTAKKNCSEDSVSTAGTSRFTAEPPCKDDDNMTAIENCSEDSVSTAGTSRFTAEPPCKDDDNMTAIENCSEDSVSTAGTSRFTAEPPCKDDDNMTAIENCSEDSVSTAGTSRFTAEPPCKDDDNMTAIENCSEDSVSTAGTSRFTAEPPCKDDDNMTAKKNCSEDSVSTAGTSRFTAEHGRDLELYMEEFLNICHQATCDDVCLTEGFQCGLDDDLRFVMPLGDPCWTLQSYINFALWTGGSPFTVGKVDDGNFGGD
ncbi:hypothetical protein QQF64_036060 [Cirrhinus molitorella]|uniref:SET domain-containing protein n=1 Tax=Cirrhinus molitorella TaxID=172907 RepID=A0ABR3NHH1_9TELE